MSKKTNKMFKEFRMDVGILTRADLIDHMSEKGAKKVSDDDMEYLARNLSDALMNEYSERLGDVVSDYLFDEEEENE